MKRIFIGLIILMLAFGLFGCESKEEKLAKEALKKAEATLDKMNEKLDDMPSVSDVMKKSAETMTEDESMDQDDETVDDTADDTNDVVTPRKEESSACGSTLESHQVKKIKVDSFNLTSEGFTFKAYPLSADDEVIPVTTNIKVEIFPTAIKDVDKGREIDGKAVYVKSFYRKKDDVLADCGPKEIEVKFSDTQWSKDRLNMVKDGDPGSMTLTMIIGSDQFDMHFYPDRNGIKSIFPSN